MDRENLDHKPLNAVKAFRAMQPRGIEHLFEHRSREWLLMVETEFTDEAAHDPSVEQARCQ